MLNKVKKNQKGFTLVELIVVIAILAILATLIVPRIMGNVRDAERRKDLANARTIASEVAVFNAQNPAGQITTSPLTETAFTTAGLSLPSGINWPVHAQITIDANGNPSVVEVP